MPVLEGNWKMINARSVSIELHCCPVPRAAVSLVHAGRRIAGGLVAEGSPLLSAHFPDPALRSELCKARFCFASCFLGDAVHGSLKGVCNTAGGMRVSVTPSAFCGRQPRLHLILYPRKEFFTPDHPVPGSSCGLQFSASSGTATSRDASISQSTPASKGTVSQLQEAPSPTPRPLHPLTAPPKHRRGNCNLQRPGFQCGVGLLIHPPGITPSSSLCFSSLRDGGYLLREAEEEHFPLLTQFLLAGLRIKLT